MGLTTLAVVAVIVSGAVALGLWKAYSAGREAQSAGDLKQRNKDNAQTLDDVRKAVEARDDSVRVNSDPNRLREDDGFKRRQ